MLTRVLRHCGSPDICQGLVDGLPITARMSYESRALNIS